MKRLMTVFPLVLIVLSASLAGCSGQSPVTGGTATGATSQTSQSALPPPGNQVGDLAFDFTLSDLSGKEVKLSDLRGKAVVLNFWTTRCEPCRLEMPLFQAVFESRIASGELSVLAINFRESAGRVKEFLDDFSCPFPVLLDGRGEVGGLYGVSSVPATFFIDSHGVIRDYQLGSFSSEYRIEKKLESILP